MSEYQWPLALAALLFAAGMWLLLPRGVRSGRRAGAGLAAASLALLTLLVHCGMVLHHQPGEGGKWGHVVVRFTQTMPSGEALVFDGVFLALAVVTIGSAIAAVTCRSPVYCAIWFALTLLGTAGLFIYQGAQFLSVATIVVYAGAILVTFLFVLMLAQPKGTVYYDRLSWEAMVSACAGAVMVGMLTMVLVSALANPGQVLADKATNPQVARARPKEILNPEHVATIGSRLFSTHLIAVEVAGTLLMVALVGAVAIVAHEKKPGAKPAAEEGASNGRAELTRNVGP